MSSDAPVHEAQRPQAPAEHLEMPVTGAYVASRQEGRAGAGANRPRRSTLALAVMGAATLMSIGALLSAKLTGKRVTRRGATRVTGGRPTIVVMFPFTAINLYGTRPGRRFFVARSRERIQRIASAARTRLRTNRHA